MGIIKKWNSMSLILRILIGLVIGAILGFLAPKATWIGVPGELFVGALKAIAPILVFVLVASSLANSKGGNMEKFRTVIILYLASTLCAAIVSVFTSFAFKVTIPLAGLDTADTSAAPQGMMDVVMNLLKVMAVKNLMLNQKLEITSRRTTREKLLAYLSAQARAAGSDSFVIPFDRQGLADYLGVDRSALSAEIGKLRREGVIESERSAFILLRG